jgi:hypothetical protein
MKILKYWPLLYQKLDQIGTSPKNHLETCKSKQASKSDQSIYTRWEDYDTFNELSAKMLTGVYRKAQRDDSTIISIIIIILS